MKKILCIGSVTTDVIVTPADSIPAPGSLRAVDNVATCTGGCAVNAAIDQKLQVTNNADANAYIRGYLKLLDAKLKLKAEGELILSGLSADIDFQFCVLDQTLFIWGKAPDKYKKKYPVSTMERPE